MISDQHPGAERGREGEHEDPAAAERLRALKRLRGELEAAEQLLDDAGNGSRAGGDDRPTPPDRR
ncbi:hypothetical protein [Patulibacter minatonensis]|uniref:hypothetical protein n=1 Tax=Patulibacter minatonensis TaxID=298163 RepID=UPI00047D5537|nr:hypothetical protein [Patulibacter minatonensis]